MPVLAIALLAVTLAATGAGAADTVRLDPEETVRLALAASHRVAAAGARVSGSEAAVEAADAAAWPRLTASASATRQSSVPQFDVTLTPGMPPIGLYPDIRNTFAANLNLEQVVYAGGAITSNRMAARSTAEASRAEEDTTRSGIVLESRRAYWTAAATQAEVDNAHAERERAQRLLTDARSLREAGMAVRADVLSAQAQLAASELRVVRAETDAADAMATLRSLVQVPLPTAIELADRVPARLPPHPAPLAELRDEARTTRSELVSMRSSLDALAAREEAARAPSRPSVAAVAQWLMARPNQRYFPLTDTWHDSWSVALSGSWRLWDAGRTRAGAAEVRWQHRALAEDLAERERTIDLEVDTARRNLESSLAAVRAADASWEAARAREDAVRERYQAGLDTMADVLQAQAALAAAETQRVRARTSAWVAAADLAHAVGR
jgi:outer membrane protein